MIVVIGVKSVMRLPVLLVCLCLLMNPAISSASESVELTRIKDDVWVHTSYKKIKRENTPTNGLVIVGDSMLILVNTPWTGSQTEELISKAAGQFNKKVGMVFLTQAHKDKLAGIQVAVETGSRSCAGA